MKTTQKYKIFLISVLIASACAIALNVYMYLKDYDFEKHLLNSNLMGIISIGIGIFTAIISIACSITSNKRELPVSLPAASIGSRIGAGVTAVGILFLCASALLNLFAGDRISSLFAIPFSTPGKSLSVWLVKIFVYLAPIASAYFIALIITGKSNIILGSVTVIWLLLVDTYIYFDIEAIMNDPVRLSLICAVSASVISLLVDIDGACKRPMTKKKIAFQMISLFVLAAAAFSPLCLYFTGAANLSSVTGLYAVNTGVFITTLSRMITNSRYTPEVIVAEKLPQTEPETIEENPGQESVPEEPSADQNPIGEEAAERGNPESEEE